MKQWNRVIFFLLLNIFVSACTTLTILIIWDRTQSSILGDAIAGLTLGRISAQETATEQVYVPPPPAATPTPSIIVHAVVDGDTFESIASAYDVSIEVLLDENGYSQVQPLSSGDLVRVPLRFIEIDSVVGVGDLELERVIVRSLVSGELPLAGWTLEDEGGNRFVFPLVTLYAEGGTVSVYSKPGSNTVLDLFWGLDAPAWSPGERVLLRDSAGSVRAVYQIP